MRTYKQTKLFATLIAIISFAACETEDVPISSNESLINYTNKSLGVANKGNSSNIVTSETFQIVSFTQILLNDSKTNKFQYNWSTVGESNISKIELQICNFPVGMGYWETKYFKDINSNDNSIQYYSQVLYLPGCRGNGYKYTVQSRLKITYRNGSPETFSNALVLTYTGKINCNSSWP